MANLEEILGPRTVLARALGLGSKIFNLYVVCSVAPWIAKSVPDRFAANKEGLITQSMMENHAVSSCSKKT
jgi:hypothetical protein